MENAIQMKII